MNSFIEDPELTGDEACKTLGNKNAEDEKMRRKKPHLHSPIILVFLHVFTFTI